MIQKWTISHKESHKDFKNLSELNVGPKLNVQKCVIIHFYVPPYSFVLDKFYSIYGLIFYLWLKSFAQDVDLYSNIIVL